MHEIIALDAFEVSVPPRRPWDDDPDLRLMLNPFGSDPYEPDPYAWI